MTNIYFLPEGDLHKLFEEDYKLMQENMFPDGEDNMEFDDLSQNLKDINQELNDYE